MLKAIGLNVYASASNDDLCLKILDAMNEHNNNPKSGRCSVWRGFQTCSTCNFLRSWNTWKNYSDPDGDECSRRVLPDERQKLGDLYEHLDDLFIDRIR